MATICQIEELGEIPLLGLRIKGDERGISEAETLVVRPRGSGREPVFWRPETLATRLEVYEGDASAHRADLLAVVGDYLDAIGEGDAAKVHGAPGAIRHGTGSRWCSTTSCPRDGRLRHGLGRADRHRFGAGIVNRDRRFLVDAPRGLVYASFFMEFEHSIENCRAASPMGWKGPNPAADDVVAAARSLRARP